PRARPWALPPAVPPPGRRQKPIPSPPIPRRVRPRASSSIRSSFLVSFRLSPFNHADSLAARQNGRAGQADEQSMLHPAEDRTQGDREPCGILDPSKMGIEDPVATIGDENVAVLGLAERHLPGNAGLRKCLLDRPPCRAKSERNDLQGQRKTA